MKKISQNREGCIGCGTCVSLCPKYWDFGDDGKTILKGAKLNTKTGEYELEVDDIACNQETADACPVQVIKII